MVDNQYAHQLQELFRIMRPHLEAKLKESYEKHFGKTISEMTLEMQPHMFSPGNAPCFLYGTIDCEPSDKIQLKRTDNLWKECAKDMDAFLKEAGVAKEVYNIARSESHVSMGMYIDDLQASIAAARTYARAHQVVGIAS